MITSLGFIQTLVAAGIIEKDSLNSIHKVTVVAEPQCAVMINVEYFADERLVDLVGGWHDIEQAYKDQVRGRQARLLEEQMAQEIEEEAAENTRRRAEQTGME